MEPVSVIIPTFNRAHLITRAVMSVLTAIRPDDEVIVVDDGSTDNTAEMLAAFGSQIRYLRTDNHGPGRARNIGLRAAQHPLIAFLDSDDQWMPDALELKRSLMAARPDLVFCFSDFANRNEDGTIRRNFLINWHHDGRPWSEILGPAIPYSQLAELPATRTDFSVYIGDMYPLLLRQPYVPAWTSLVRRSLAGPEFQFEEELKTAEDWACYGKIARRGPAAYLECETAWNYGHSGPRVTSQAGRIGYLDAHLTIVERIYGRDEEFVRAHAREYREVLVSIHTQRARWYLSRGRAREARSEIRAAGGGVPRSLRLLAGLPSPLLNAAGGARRIAMDVVNRIR